MTSAREERAATTTWTKPAAPSYARYPLGMQTRSGGTLGRVAQLRVSFTDSALGHVMQRWVMRLPTHSRIRRAVFRLGIDLSIQSLLAKDRRGLACFYAADAEIIVPPWPGLAERYTGSDGFLEFFTAWVEGWDDFVLELVEIFDLGEQTLVLGYMHTRGAASGVRTTQPFSATQTYGNGKIVRGEWFLTWEDGLAAAGLEGQPLPG